MIVTGEYIKRLREELGISQTELAKLAKVSQAHIAKIESEKVDPRLSTVNRILFVLSGMERSKKCSEVMSRNIMSVKPGDPVRKAVDVMRNMSISQLPVLSGKNQIGSLREATIVRNLDRRLETLKVRDVMDKPFPVVDSQDVVDILLPLLDFHPAVLVSERGKLAGIITKSDLLSLG